VLPDGATRHPDVRLGEGVDDVAHAAARAAAEPGTEVSGTEIAGSARGPRGRWAVLLNRVRTPLPNPLQLPIPLVGRRDPEPAAGSSDPGTGDGQDGERDRVVGSITGPASPQGATGG
jgi:hypothetical protein